MHSKALERFSCAFGTSFVWGLASGRPGWPLEPTSEYLFVPSLMHVHRLAMPFGCGAEGGGETEAARRSDIIYSTVVIWLLGDIPLKPSYSIVVSFRSVGPRPPPIPKFGQPRSTILLVPIPPQDLHDPYPRDLVLQMSSSTDRPRRTTQFSYTPASHGAAYLWSADSKSGLWIEYESQRKHSTQTLV